MLTGFNTDIKHGDRVFHVQTEDRGLGNPVIESLVYVGGEILLSKKSPYKEHIESGRVDEKTVKAMMDLQHRRIIEAIRRGRFDGVKPGEVPAGEAAAAQPISGATPLSPAAAAAAAAILSKPDSSPGFGAPRSGGIPPPARAAAPVSRPANGPERSLDQVIIEYLASEAASERIELSLMKGGELVAGELVPLSVRAATSLTDRPIAGAQVTVRVVSTTGPPSVLYRGVTGSDGLVKVTVGLPEIGNANAALIVSATSQLGNAEVKQLLRRRGA